MNFIHLVILSTGKVELLGFILIHGDLVAEGFVVFRHKHENFFRVIKKDSIFPQFEMITDKKYRSLNQNIVQVTDTTIVLEHQTVVLM